METKRLYFRERTQLLLEEILTLAKTDQMNFFGLEVETELESEIRRAERALADWKTTWLIWDLLENKHQQVIGNIAFHNWHKNYERAELGYYLHERFRTKGYMQEAMDKVIAYGFSEMNLNRIEAFISPDNLPSIKLIEKFGFKLEGRLKQHHKSKGQFEDSLIYALLKSENYT